MNQYSRIILVKLKSDNFTLQLHVEVLSPLHWIPSLILKDRFPLLGECSHAFLPVVGGKGCVEHSFLEIQTLLKCRFEGSIDGFFAHCDNQWRTAGDLITELDGFIDEFFWWKNFTDKTCVLQE